MAISETRLLTDLVTGAKPGVAFKLRGNAGSRSDGPPSKLCATLDLSRRLRMTERLPPLNFRLDLHAGLASHRRGQRSVTSTGAEAGARARPSRCADRRLTRRAEIRAGGTT